MKAIVFPEPGKAVLTETAVPEIGSVDLLIQIEYSGISPGTERWMLKGKLEVPGEPPFEFPHAPGYQAAGTVIEAGAEAGEYKPGDRVFSRACKAPAGWKGSWWGGHCEYHVAKIGRDIIRVPDKVSTEAAACLLLAQVGYNGAMKPALRDGDVAVIIGDGLVGQYAAQVLTYRGAHTVLSGLSPKRLALAGKYSAAEVYDNCNFEFPEYIAGRYPEGVDIVLETASTMKTVEEAAGMLKRHGQLVLNGYYPPGDSCINWHWLRRKEPTLYCADSRNDKRLQGTMDLLADGAIKAEELITRRFPPDQAPEAYSMLLENRQDFLGLMIDWR
jgi:bacteriochlorophyllide a dehydrogenase